MEAMLVQEIAEVRATEALIVQSMRRGSDSVTDEYERLQEQVNRIEGLLAVMDSSSFYMPSATIGQRASAAYRS